MAHECVLPWSHLQVQPLHGRSRQGRPASQILSVWLKCQKNYKYIFWFVFDTAITFCHSTVWLHSQTHVLLKNFRIRLAERLIGNYCSQKRAGWPHSSSVPSHPSPCLPTGQLAPHLPSHQTGLRKPCVYCSKYGIPRQRRMTVWFCAACDSHPPLRLERETAIVIGIGTKICRHYDTCIHHSHVYYLPILYPAFSM